MDSPSHRQKSQPKSISAGKQPKTPVPKPSPKRKKKLPYGRLLDVGLRRVRFSSLLPSPENETIYRPVRGDEELQALADDIGKRGIQNNIIVTRDKRIVSGHRRYAAAKLAGLTWGVVKVLPNIRQRMTASEFKELLTRDNMQRVKTFAETLRESIVLSDPEECHRLLMDERRASSSVSSKPVELRGFNHRRKIRRNQCQMVRAVKQTLRDLRYTLPISVRKIHYYIVSRLAVKPLLNSDDPTSTYDNIHKHYKRLDELTVLMRTSGLIPMDWICDETRSTKTWDVYLGPSEFIKKEMDGFMKGYYRDYLQSQPNQIEVLVEKMTMQGLAERVASTYCIPTTVGRGYCSLPPRYAMAERFKASGKTKLIILILSDFDPDGERICSSFAESMRDDFGCNVHPIKVGLTQAQVHEFNLPPSMSAKKTSTAYKAFADKYGDNAYELEAMDEEALEQILRDNIDSVLDIKAFNYEVGREKEDAAGITRAREIVKRTLEGIEELTDFANDGGEE